LMKSNSGRFPFARRDGRSGKRRRKLAMPHVDAAPTLGSSTRRSIPLRDLFSEDSAVLLFG
jgi:hypothetical protein